MSEYPCGACNQYPCVCDVSEEYDNLGPNYLCYSCGCYDGKCSKYEGMPFQLFKRKNKCKHFKNWKPHDFNEDGFLNDIEWNEFVKGRR